MLKRWAIDFREFHFGVSWGGRRRHIASLPHARATKVYGRIFEEKRDEPPGRTTFISFFSLPESKVSKAWLLIARFLLGFVLVSGCAD